MENTVEAVEKIERALEAGVSLTVTQLRRTLGTVLRDISEDGVRAVTNRKHTVAVLVSPMLLNNLIAEVRRHRGRTSTLAKIYDAKVAAMSQPANVVATEKLLGYPL